MTILLTCSLECVFDCILVACAAFSFSFDFLFLSIFLSILYFVYDLIINKYKVKLYVSVLVASGIMRRWDHSIFELYSTIWSCGIDKVSVRSNSLVTYSIPGLSYCVRWFRCISSTKQHCLLEVMYCRNYMKKQCLV